MLKNSILFVLLYFYCINSHSLYVSDNVELIGAYTNDLTNEPETLVGMRSNWSNKWFNINGELVASDKDGELNASVSSFSSTIIFPYYKSLDTRFTIGKVILPIGIHERQRLVPTSIGPRLSNDSFLFKEYSRFIPPASLGAILELDFNNISFDFGYYTPKPFEISTDSINIKTDSENIIIVERERIKVIEIDDREPKPDPEQEANNIVELILDEEGGLTGGVSDIIEGSITEDGADGEIGEPEEPETPNPPQAPDTENPPEFQLPEDDPTVEEEVESSEEQVIIEVLEEIISPSFKEVGLVSEKIFFQFSYDNSEDLLVDFEILHTTTETESNIIDGLRTEPYQDTRYFLGIEKINGRIITSSQLIYNVYESDKSEVMRQFGISKGLSFDMGKYVLHATANTSNGDLHNINDLNMGVSIIHTDNIYSRINLRSVQGTYTSPEQLYATRLVLFEGCEGCSFIERTYTGNKEDRSQISEIGLEYRLELRF